MDTLILLLALFLTFPDFTQTDDLADSRAPPQQSYPRTLPKTVAAMPNPQAVLNDAGSGGYIKIGGAYSDLKHVFVSRTD